MKNLLLVIAILTVVSPVKAQRVRVDTPKSSPSGTLPVLYKTSDPVLDRINAIQKSIVDKRLADERAAQDARDAAVAAQKAAEQAEAQKQAQVAQAVVVAPKPVYVPPAPAVVAGCGDNALANYIYMHESGCNTTSTNAGGCYGIGQDCNGIVRAQCGASYACQNAYFTNYANSRYGGWAGAYAFWLNNHWW